MISDYICLADNAVPPSVQRYVSAEGRGGMQGAVGVWQESGRSQVCVEGVEPQRIVLGLAQALKMMHGEHVSLTSLSLFLCVVLCDIRTKEDSQDVLHMAYSRKFH